MLTVTVKYATDKAKSFVDQGYLYLYGYKEANNPINQADNNALRKLYPSTWTDVYYQYANANLGKRAIDCSGLVCQCLGIGDINSTSISLLPVNKPSEYMGVSLEDRQPGDILWKAGHVGLCVGQNEVVEARSRTAGVKVFSFTSQPWETCIRPAYMKGESNFYAKEGWQRDDTGWWYAYSTTKGSYYRNGVALINEKQYAFNKDGYCVAPAMLVTDEKGAVVEVHGPILQ